MKPIQSFIARRRPARVSEPAPEPAPGAFERRMTQLLAPDAPLTEGGPAHEGAKLYRSPMASDIAPTEIRARPSAPMDGAPTGSSSAPAGVTASAPAAMTGPWALGDESPMDAPTGRDAPGEPDRASLPREDRPHIPAPAEPARPAARKPWDMDGGAGPEARGGADLAGAAAAALAQMPAGDAAAAPGGRPKTRLLGFGAAPAEADLFTAPAASAPGLGARFPVGWLAVTEGPGRGATFPLVAGLSTIGRDASQTVPLDFGDTAISRDNHASVAYDEEENRLYIGHGGKSNVVRLNGKPLLSTEELAHGDEIRIGKTVLRLVALCGPEFSWSETAEDGDAMAAPDA